MASAAIHRVAVAGLRLDALGLPQGAWRLLSEAELLAALEASQPVVAAPAAAAAAARRGAGRHNPRGVAPQSRRAGRATGLSHAVPPSNLHASAFQQERACAGPHERAQALPRAHSRSALAAPRAPRPARWRGLPRLREGVPREEEAGGGRLAGQGASPVLCSVTGGSLGRQRVREGGGGALQQPQAPLRGHVSSRQRSSSSAAGPY